jgi:hypothetical protein
MNNTIKTVGLVQYKTLHKFSLTDCQPIHYSIRNIYVLEFGAAITCHPEFFVQSEYKNYLSSHPIQI